jgi:DNA-3-methyladenine glycosylase II
VARKQQHYRDGTPWDAADQHLAAVDATMRELVRTLGPVDPAPVAVSRDPFGALILAIVSQQLSTRSARAIYDRLVAYFGGRIPSAKRLLAADPDELRTTAGLSHAKTSSLRSLAEHVVSRELNLTRLPELSDDEVKQQLVAVRGIGEWTADVFMMFNLHRPDVLAAGDLGLRKAFQVQYGLKQTPDVATLTQYGARWSPYRTRACLYLWRTLEPA